MPNIFKNFSLSKAQLYQFPSTEELLLKADDEEKEEQSEQVEQGEQTPEEEPAVRGYDPTEPISYARLQADMILQDARRQAEEILAQARQEAREELEQAAAAAREDGRREGYAQGIAQAMEEGKRQREEQAIAQQAAVQQFLERAGAELDRQLDQNVGELRDLVLAIAEKVVCVSLKSSAEVICRMIQTAIDKRKRREWVHIYIAECDAKRLTQMPASLTAALSALSDRVRIIPMADDESGTCIIEMPDEIVDASAGTQLNNLRALLMDTPSGGTGSELR